jgi:Uncharacterized protein conserved in bacteria (DUF2188)
MKGELHIVERDSGWAVQRPDNARVDKRYANKRDAVEAGRKTLREEGGGELIIHGRDGRIRDKDTVFGRRDA